MKIFENVEQLKLARLNAGQLVEVKNIGKYKIDVAGSTGITLANSAVATPIMSGTSMNIRQFGAVGDGVTDDSAAFNAAVASAPIDCYVPEGTYLIGSEISISDGAFGISFYSNKRPALFNHGGTATLKLGYDGNLIAITGTGTSKYFDITFDGIYFDGNGYNRTAGTFIYWTEGARGLNLRNGQATNFRDYGLYCYEVGGLTMNDFDIFNCGYNIYADTLGDSQVYGGQTGSGAGGGASWVNDNIYMLGSGGNTHFINHRPNFSGGIGVRIGGNVTRCSFIGGLCDNNLGPGFVLEDNCTAIKIQGMDIFDNGTTTVKQSGIVITTGQNATGFSGPAGIQILGNSIFDRNKGTVDEVMSAGIDISTIGNVSLDRIAIVGNNLEQVDTPIATFPGVKVNSDKTQANKGVTTSVSGQTVSIPVGAVGVQTISGIDVSALTSDLTTSSTFALNFVGATNLDFIATVIPTAITPTTFDLKVYVGSASATSTATVKVQWQIFN